MLQPTAELSPGDPMRRVAFVLVILGLSLLQPCTEA
jgi:hypothetical protein